MTAANRAATNQAPPLVGHNVVDDGRRARRGGHPPRGRRHRRRPAGARCRGRHRRGAGARLPGQPARARAHDVRPLRAPHRRGGLPPVLALADGACGRSRPPGGALGAAGGRRGARPRPPGRRLHGVVAHRPGARLPDLDDVRRGPGAAGRRAAREGVGPGAGRRRRTTPASGRSPGSAGALAGMGMTEKQGGSDVRANVTEARPTGVDGEYTLHGHKWFTSAPMNDVFLVLAQAPERAVVLPRPPRAARRHPQPARRRPAQGQARQPRERVGRARARRHRRRCGSATRVVGCARSSRWSRRPGSTACSGPTALMRHTLDEASWHVAHRSAFGGLLADKPLMQNVVADLAVEAEAATALADPARRRRRRRPTTRTRRRCAGSRCRWRSSGSASGRRASWPRRWSASAATGTSRSPACPCATARRR